MKAAFCVLDRVLRLNFLLNLNPVDLSQVQDGNGALKCRFQKYGELQIRAERLQKHGDMHERLVHSVAIQRRGVRTSRGGQRQAPMSDREDVEHQLNLTLPCF